MGVILLIKMASSLHCEVNFYCGGAVRRLVKYLTWDICRFIADVDLKKREREREEKREKRRGRETDVEGNGMRGKVVRVRWGT